MNDKEYAQRRREMAARRNQGLVYQTMRLGGRWYVIRWPDGKILTSKANEEDARALATSYAAATAA